MKIVIAADATSGAAGAREWLGAVRSALMRRCAPPAESVVFDGSSLFPGGPSRQVRVAVDTLVGFEQFGDQIQMAAAAGLVNGTSIRREAWPRRLAAVQVETQGPIEVAGTQLAAGRFSIGNGAIWAGPSVLGWGHTGVVYGRSDENRTLQGEFPIRIISDGHWAETLSCDKVDEDFVLRCRLAKRAHWVRIVSSALLPAGHAASEVQPRRFGIAIVGLAVDSDDISLDSPALISGFYPREGDAPRHWRWTDGNGLVALNPSTTERTLTIRFTNWHEMLVS